MVTDAEHSKLKRERRKVRGLIQFQKWVTPKEKELLLNLLEGMRNGEITFDTKG